MMAAEGRSLGSALQRRASPLLSRPYPRAAFARSRAYGVRIGIAPPKGASARH